MTAVARLSETFAGAGVDKQAVARSFSQAASRYGETAQVQRRIAQNLCDLMAPHLAEQGASGVVVDLGSGSGPLLPALSELAEPDCLIPLDLAQGMLSAIPVSQRIHPIAADFDALPLADNSVDLVFSSMSMQWSNYPERLIKDMQRVIKPNGLLVFNSLLEGSVKELNAAWETIDGKQHGLGYPSYEFWSKCANDFGECMAIEDKTEVQHFEEIADLLASVRSIGASDHRMNRRKSFLGKASYELFKEALASTARDSSSGKYALSYRVFYAVLKNSK